MDLNGNQLANIPIFVAHIFIQVYSLLNREIVDCESGGGEGGGGALQQHINDHPFFGHIINSILFLIAYQVSKLTNHIDHNTSVPRPVRPVKTGLS